MLDVIWDDDDEVLLRRTIETIHRMGAEPIVRIELDAPLGLGDTDALIRFVLSLYQLYEGEPAFRKENFERLLVQINRDVFLEVWEDIFGLEE